MNKKLFLLLIFLSPFSLKSQNRSIGVNIAEISPFASQWVYTDAFKQSAEWTAKIPGQVDSYEELVISLNEQGFPRQVPFLVNGTEYHAQTILLAAQPDPWFYPSGNYQLIFEGTGQIIMDWDVDNTSQAYSEPNTIHNISITNPTSLGIRLIVTESDSLDPIRNIRFIFPGFETEYTRTPFHPLFLELLESFEVLRFMKPLHSENNTIEDWKDRTKPDFYTYSSDLQDTILNGMPYEDVIRLSNLAIKNPWITIPYRATDEYVDSLATLFEENLDPELRLHLEYSNETWNPSYPEQRAYMEQQGMAQNLSQHPDSAAYLFAAKRSLEVFRIFEETFSNPEQRLFTILGSQSDPFTSTIHLKSLSNPEVNPHNQTVDAIAVAAYAGVLAIDEEEENGTICSVTTQDFLESVINHIPIEFEEMYSDVSELANSLGIELVAYEGGQHIAKLGFVDASECAADLIIEGSRLPEMETLFCTVFNEWYDTYNGSLLMSFNLVEAYSSFGAFGLLESMLQNRDKAPKWAAHQNCAFSEPVSSELSPNIPDRLELHQNYPNPFNPSTTIAFGVPQTGKVTLEVFDVLGRKVATLLNGENKTAGRYTVNFNASNLASGMYIYRLRAGNVVMTKKLTLIK